MSERIALIDMDGTVADYEYAMQQSYDAMIAPGEMSYNEASRKYGRDQWPDHLWNRMDTIKRQTGWWRNLPQYQMGMEIVGVLRKMGFLLNIATQGPSTKSAAWAEKVEWVREHMPYADVHITEKKSLLYGKVLVDDWPPFAEEWLAHRPRGLVIMPAHHYNEGIDHPQILRYQEGHEENLEYRVRALFNDLEG